jgi:hypothetical protein
MTKLYIGNLPLDVRERELDDLFYKPSGLRVWLARGRPGFALSSALGRVCTHQPSKTWSPLSPSSRPPSWANGLLDLAAKGGGGAPVQRIISTQVHGALENTLNLLSHTPCLCAVWQD